MTLNQNNLVMTLIEQIKNTFWKFILDKGNKYKFIH